VNVPVPSLNPEPEMPPMPAKTWPGLNGRLADRTPIVVWTAQM